MSSPDQHKHSIYEHTKNVAGALSLLCTAYIIASGLPPEQPIIQSDLLTLFLILGADVGFAGIFLYFNNLVKKQQ